MSEDHTISKIDPPKKDKGEFYMNILYIIGAIIIVGILMFLNPYRGDAQTPITLKELKPIYTKEKVTLDNLAQYTSDQFEYTYGRLEYMKRQLDRIEQACGN